MRVFSFEQIDGKWKSSLCGKTAFYYFSTFGFPIELYQEEINTLLSGMTNEERIELMAKGF